MKTRRSALFVLLGTFALVLTAGAGGCHHDPGHPFISDVDAAQSEVIWLHARRDVQTIAQHVATLTQKGGDRRLLTNSLGYLSIAQKGFDSSDPKVVADAIISACDEAINALKKSQQNPEDRDHEIACLQALKDAVQACKRDMLCIAKALLAYINCIHGFDGPAQPVNP